MARSEAQKRADRKYETKKREVRGENWMVMGYPDSLPENWVSVLDDLHIEITISPLHDQDINADGTPKKPHYHILLIFESLKSLSQVRDIANALNAPLPQKMDSKRGAARYQCHLDNAEKAQYCIEDVRELGGADYRALISMSRDKYEVVGEIIDWCVETNCHSFARLLNYARENNEKWFRGLCDNCAWVIKEYLKSAKWEADMEAAEEKAPTGQVMDAGATAMRPIVARDARGRRLAVCESCGTIDRVEYFTEYGGEEPNMGICKECAKSGCNG